jgi:hypothetical protein
MDTLPNHWLLRVGDGEHFISSSKYNIWGIYSKQQKFINEAQEGDILWFIANKKSKKGLLAMAIYTKCEERHTGPLISLTKTNDELGWVKTEGEWDIEVHYKNLYILTKYKLDTNIKGACTIRNYNDKCELNLPLLYKNITESRINKKPIIALH